jgi:hypothetical protein
MSLTSFRTLSALIVGAAAALALIALYRGAGREAGPAPDDAHATHEAALAARSAASDNAQSAAPTPTPVNAPAGPAPDERALARQAELRGASESFRTSTLLIAIRENGFVCSDVMSAEQGSDPLGGWHVACRGALTYFVAVGATGELVVEPVPVGDNFLVNPFNSVPPEQLPNPLTPPNRQSPRNR